MLNELPQSQKTISSPTKGIAENKLDSGISNLSEVTERGS